MQAVRPVRYERDVLRVVLNKKQGDIPDGQFVLRDFVKVFRYFLFKENAVRPFSINGIVKTVQRNTLPVFVTNRAQHSEFADHAYEQP
jgi:hypothetical protein